MTKTSFRVAAGAFCAILAMTGLAQAQSVRLLGDFRDWSAYATSEGAGALCFVISKPTQVNPSPDGYTQAYLYLTHRPAENQRFELNVVAGFSFAPDTPASITVGGNTYPLFTQADAAWLQDASQSANLASAIRAGSSMSIEGTSDKGIRVTQAYSLSGATAAQRAIDAECP